MLPAQEHVFFIRSEAFIIIIIIIILSLWCCLLVQKWRLSIQGSHWNWDTEEGPRRRETRVFSHSFSLTVFSFSLFILSISFSLSLSRSCRSSSSSIGAVQSADSPFMADGGRWGVGLLECWHVPIRATVLHYSISARQQHSGHITIWRLSVPSSGRTVTLQVEEETNKCVTGKCSQVSRFGLSRSLLTHLPAEVADPNPPYFVIKWWFSPNTHANFPTLKKLIAQHVPQKKLS